MDITKLAKIQRQIETKNSLQNLTREKDELVYSELSIAVAKLFSKVGQADETTCLKAYCKALAAFLGVANAKKWVYLLLLTPEQEEKLASKWRSRSEATVYLTLQQQILKAHLERRNEYLVRAWNIFIKFGLTDLKYSPEMIENCFADLYMRKI